MVRAIRPQSTSCSLRLGRHPVERGVHRRVAWIHTSHAGADLVRASVLASAPELANRLAQLGGVNLGQPDLDLLFPDKDGQGVAVVDRDDHALGGGACPCLA